VKNDKGKDDVEEITRNYSLKEEIDQIENSFISARDLFSINLKKRSEKDNEKI